MADWRETCHPDIRLMLTYWESKRRGRRMPSRADIEPEEIRIYLPYVSLVDVVADERRFVYRLVGTREVAARGADPTGRTVKEAYFASSAAAALANYERVCRERAPYHETDAFQAVDRYVNEENIFLPLSGDDETVNMILVFSINRDLYRQPAGEKSGR